MLLKHQNIRLKLMIHKGFKKNIGPRAVSLMAVKVLGFQMMWGQTMTYKETFVDLLQPLLKERMAVLHSCFLVI